MSDTQRTLAALITILADNTTGQISAQDIRDLLVSLTPSRGGMTIEPADAVETVISTQATWTALAGTWTVDGAADTRDWSMDSNGVLTYGGTESQAVLVSGKISLTPGAGNTEYSLTHALDGTPNERFAASHRFAGPQSGDAETTVPIIALVTIAAGETISLYLRNDTGTENATATRGTVSVLGILK